MRVQRLIGVVMLVAASALAQMAAPQSAQRLRNDVGREAWRSPAETSDAALACVGGSNGWNQRRLDFAGALAAPI
jgi:hypothetical protein